MVVEFSSKRHNHFVFVDHYCELILIFIILLKLRYEENLSTANDSEYVLL